MGTLAVSGQFTPGVKSGLTHGEKPRSVCRRNKETCFPSSLRESSVGSQPAIPSFKSLWNVKSSTCHCFTWIRFLCSRKRDLDDWFCSNKWRLPKWEQTGYISRAWVSALITYVWPTQRQEGSGELLSNKREDFKDPWQEVVGKGKPDGLTRSGWLVWEHLVFPDGPVLGARSKTQGSWQSLTKFWAACCRVLKSEFYCQIWSGHCSSVY